MDLITVLIILGVFYGVLMFFDMFFKVTIVNDTGLAQSDASANRFDLI